MKTTHKRLTEITRIIQNDERARQLMDEVIVNCVDYVLGDIESGNPPDAYAAERLMGALDRFNSYLRKYDDAPREGLFSGTPEQLAAWAESLTEQIWTNRPH